MGEKERELLKGDDDDGSNKMKHEEKFISRE
jgi:hypothetical protein